QNGHPGDVPVVLAGLVRAAEVDVLHLVGRDPRALDRPTHDEGSEVVRADTGESSSIAADRRANAREDDRSAHRPATKSTRAGASSLPTRDAPRSSSSTA